MNQTETTDTMRALVLLYLEGETTPEQEKQVKEYIASGAEAMAQFRQWEAEWESSCQMSERTQREWALVEMALDNCMEQEQERENRRNLWRGWMINAAAILLFGLITSAVTWFIVDNKQAPDYYTCTVPYGSKSKITLPDGSVVWLNAGSTLTYNTLFDKKNRQVELHGEAYFEVTKHQGKEFVVSTRGCDVTVKGTHFNVKAYDDDSFISTSLLEGKVVVNSDTKEMLLLPGEEAILDMNDGSLVKTAMGGDPNAWIDRRITFDSIELGALAKVLSRDYDVRIHVMSETLKHKCFSISLRNKETVSDVISALQAIEPFRVERQGKDIYLR